MKSGYLPILASEFAIPPNGIHRIIAIEWAEFCPPTVGDIIYAFQSITTKRENKHNKLPKGNSVMFLPRRHHPQRIGT